MDEFVYELMQTMLPSRPPLQAAVDRHTQARAVVMAMTVNTPADDKLDSGAPPSRRLLQRENPDTNLVIPAANVETHTPLSKTRDTATAQLHAAAPFFDVTSFTEICGDVNATNKQLPVDLATILTETYSNAFDSPDAKSCMLSFGTVQKISS